MSRGKSLLRRGFGALTRSAARLRKGRAAKTCLILALSAFLVMVCTPGAFAFEGSVSGRFVNPVPLIEEHIEGLNTATITFGQPYYLNHPYYPDSDPNTFHFEGTDFNTTFDQPFILGQFEYHNGHTRTGTSFDTISLIIDLAFTDPEGIEQEFTHTLDLELTTNNHQDPDDNADYLIFPLDTAPLETYILDGQAYTLKLTALENVTGGGFFEEEYPDRLYVYEAEDHEGGYEEDTATVTLMAMLELADVYRYEYICQYNSTDPDNGDYYTGYFYHNLPYNVDDEVLPFTDENGQEGLYKITAKSEEPVDPLLQGQVFVDSYFDYESDNTYTLDDSNPVGVDFLGSESGFIIMDEIPEYFFGAETPGGVIFEADLVAYAYDFRFDYSNGDCYTGTVYAEPERYGGITDNPLWSWTANVEDGLTGAYAITEATGGYEVGLAGQVTVDTYDDSESGTTYLAANGEIIGGDGDNYLGSESGHIITAGVPEYFFGAETPGGIIFEADLAAYAYNFTFTYGNGDYYHGTLFAAPEEGYGVEYIQTAIDENGQEGYYEITGQGAAVDGLAGQVFVDTYYDEESDNFYTPLHAGTAVGDDYLGSERDYLLLNGYVLNRFGIGPVGSEEVLYEADVTYAQDVYNRHREPFRTIRLNSLHRCYILQGTRHPELFDDAV